MPVKVTISRNSAGTSTEAKTHDDAGGFYLKDGHLFVTDSPFSNANEVAVYAPGQWADATILPKAD